MTSAVKGLTPVSCTGCGDIADELPVAWTMQTSRRGLEYLCAACTRTSVREIESQLPEQWW